MHGCTDECMDRWMNEWRVGSALMFVLGPALVQTVDDAGGDDDADQMPLTVHGTL